MDYVLPIERSKALNCRGMFGGGEYDAVKMPGCEKSVIVRLLSELSDRSSVLVVIGAVGGYFGVGVLYAKFFDRAIRYEASDRDESMPAKNAGRNGVGGQIEIRGTADKATFQVEIAPEPGCVILYDIEGLEFRFFDDAVLERLRSIRIIIELHPHLVTHGWEDRQALLARAQKYFSLSLLRGDDPSPSHFRELDDLADDVRCLAFGEGRGRAGEWAHLSPKAARH
ncbi:hypothetical protein [Tabrizicola sp. TH137]|uniref:hypothetical protein n=1 Tax=Tabrizicola sp. TH137 TaxID=2067452 RepID=UPI00117FE795|nr:hypothetical protein [Tabrizicola sp. TH137]